MDEVYGCQSEGPADVYHLDGCTGCRVKMEAEKQRAVADGDLERALSIHSAMTWKWRPSG